MLEKTLCIFRIHLNNSMVSIIFYFYHNILIFTFATFRSVAKDPTIIDLEIVWI